MDEEVNDQIARGVRVPPRKALNREPSTGPVDRLEKARSIAGRLRRLIRRRREFLHWLTPLEQRRSSRSGVDIPRTINMEVDTSDSGIMP